jgi:Regulator of chromosome condensation (RCC1) repeat
MASQRVTRGEALRPRLQLRDRQAVNPALPKLRGDVLQVRGQSGDAPRLAVVLVEKLVDEFLHVSGLTSGVAAISAGYGQTCALTTAHGAKCWGLNVVGEVGDGTTTDRYVPVDVFGLDSGVAALAVGGFHTCALTSAGGAKCWGWNRFGQLGNGASSDSSIPVDVFGLASGGGALSAGEWHTCARTDSPGLVCWGRNGFGELGDGTSNKSSVPVNVIGAWPPPPPRTRNPTALRLPRRPARSGRQHATKWR